MTILPPHHIQKQTGNILVLFCIGFLAMLGTAAMALDGGHLLLNKSRLQLLVDAAALSGASELDQGGNQDDARQAVVDIIAENLTFAEFSEIADTLDLSAADIYSESVTQQLFVEFSERPDPFMPTASATATYIRVGVTGISLDNFLAQVLGLNKQISASAVSGPSTALVECYSNLVPMVVCGANNDPSDNFGLPIGQLQLLKISSNTSSPIGPGNFQLVRLEGASGAADVRKAMAGEDYNGEQCFTADPTAADGQIDTEPGNSVGPVAQGLNTRMGEWQGGQINNIEHPRDLNTCEGEHIPLDADDNLDTTSEQYANAYRYNEYLTDTATADSNAAVCSDVNHNGDIVAPDPARVERRILQILVGDCDGQSNGADQLGYFGSACFFMTQAVQQKGTDAYVIGEYIESCNSEGVPSGNAADNAGPYKLVLYHAGKTDA
ncbi:pilus assembly protein TadG-related protein [Alteromonas sp. ASW11-19]|uniref:Pilus assembly protein TadG-related protein n=1 Tax=Alteromonas salexigens TaxID=2982530 RepID=A0ABT2VPR9_9ALTE|nr:pilus assembly protein TadG-related protein [Alteromonas salexigens]MCU7554873.1 pilus assembly protein TadG-related protein [Alteromonas salexigens]